MTTRSEPARAGIEVVLLVAAWCAVVNQIGTQPEPRKVYLALLGLVALVIGGPHAARALRLVPGLGRLRALAAPILAGAVIAFGGFHLQDFSDQVGAPRNLNRLVDIAENTYAAGRMVFDGGVNPYAFRGQIWHNVAGRPGVKVEAGRTTMHGLHYKYGYPYFPAMFLSYEPFRQLVGTFNAIRIANLCFVLATLALLLLLARRLAAPPDLPLAALAAAAAFLCAKRQGYDLYNLGVTDIVLPCYALLGFLALARGRDLLGGVCLGLCQAAKLLPGGLLFVVTALWLPGWRRRLRFSAAFTAVVALLVGPFLLADPAAFVSATVLYYLVFYPEGDGSALYSTLPMAWRARFQLAHLASIAVLMLLGLRGHRGELGRLLLVSSACYLLFLAGNKLFHLNYLWSIHAPACAALVLRALPPREAEDKPAPVAV
jgi:hypothetical protein